MKLWIRVDVAIASDPNVLELANRLKVAFPEAVGWCVLVWAKIAEHRPSGDISGIGISTLESWANFSPRKGRAIGSFGKAFLDLFASDDEISGWHDRQGALIDRAEKERTRKRRGKRAEIPKNSAPTERNGTERNATERNREHLQSDASSEISDAAPVRDRFLAKFYDRAPQERRAEVEQQLAASLSPSGARIRKGEFVSARSPAHLEKCIQSVIDNPPQKADAAIVWVLRKLADPELNDRGQTVTEAASDQSKRDEKLFTIYHAEKTEAGRAWALEHPDEWQEIEARVERTLPPSDKPMYPLIRQTQMAIAAGDAAGFAPFEEWLSTREVSAA